jgi:XTP/dITP diphosphohydrolase
MAHAMSIVVVTSNRSRLASIKELLGDLPVEVLSTHEALGDVVPNIEPGDSFEENARNKAQAVAEAAMMVTIALDHGLEVDALGGRPGVRSARFAREGATDAENNAELLRTMEEIEDSQRTARFRAVFALVDPWDDTNDQVVSGTCEGRIARSPSGTAGFGYESLFVLEGEDVTLSELSGAEHDQKSARAKALAALRPKLEATVRRRLDEAGSIMRGSYAPPSSQSFS